MSKATTVAGVLQDRWVFPGGTGLEQDANVQKTIALLERAAKAGYNGVVQGVPTEYSANVRKVRDACRRLGLKFITPVFPIGYSGGVLRRDPNLAEGLPVVDAPFVVRNGTLVPADDPARILNGRFEEHKGNEPSDWLVDMPGKISFIDTDVKFEGKASLRMQDIVANDPQHGNGRAWQPLKLRPFSYYHVSVAVKTQDFQAADYVWEAHDLRIVLLGSPGDVPLNYFQPALDKTQDWRRVDMVFNSLEFSEAMLYLGVWGCKGGKIWWADARIEPAGLVNVLRRDGAPLRVTSEDGRTLYKEGRDFGPVRDPKLGTDSVWHEPPVVPVPAGSALKEGQRVLFSYYHPVMIYRDQMTCCMADPKVYDILKWQAEQAHKNYDPDGYFMSHDEIRCQGWDESCVRMKMTPAQLLADNVKRCVGILHSVDPGKPVYVWSDMFDPYHNALKTGRYYFVKGDGPWDRSWEGLPKEVTVVNWHGHEPGRLDSLKFFAARGHKQILAGYYDADPAKVRPWLAEAAKVEGVVGAMYTTWVNNYADLEKFAAELGSPPASPVAGKR